jgi:hypothetical protein
MSDALMVAQLAQTDGHDLMTLRGHVGRLRGLALPTRKRVKMWSNCGSC